MVQRRATPVDIDPPKSPASSDGTRTGRPSRRNQNWCSHNLDLVQTPEDTRNRHRIDLKSATKDGNRKKIEENNIISLIDNIELYSTYPAPDILPHNGKDMPSSSEYQLELLRL